MDPAGNSRKKTSTVATKRARAARRKKLRQSASPTVAENIVQKYKPHVALVRVMGKDEANAHCHRLDFSTTCQRPVGAGPQVSNIQENDTYPSPHAPLPGENMPDMQTQFHAFPLQRKKRKPRTQSTPPLALTDPSVLPEVVPRFITSAATDEHNTSNNHYPASSSGSVSHATPTMSPEDINYTTQANTLLTSLERRHFTPHLSASSWSDTHSSGRTIGTHQPYPDHPDVGTEHIDYCSPYAHSLSPPTPAGWPQGYLVRPNLVSQWLDEPESAYIPHGIQPFQAVATHHIQTGYSASRPPAHTLAGAASETELELRRLDPDGNRMAPAAQFEIAIEPKFLSGRIAHDPAGPHFTAPLAPTVEETVYSQRYPSFAVQDDALFSAFTASLQEFGPVQFPADLTGSALYAAGGGPDPDGSAPNDIPLETTGPSAFAGGAVEPSQFAWSINGEVQDTGCGYQAGFSLPVICQTV